MANSCFVSIKRSSDFEKLKKNGKRLRLSPWLLVNLAKNDFGTLRVGFTIQKKVGSAVVRNRIRRVFREKIRELLRTGKARSLDINFIFLPISTKASEQAFFKKAGKVEFASIFEKLESVLLEKS